MALTGYRYAYALGGVYVNELPVVGFVHVGLVIKISTYSFVFVKNFSVFMCETNWPH